MGLFHLHQDQNNQAIETSITGGLLWYIMVKIASKNIFSIGLPNANVFVRAIPDGQHEVPLVLSLEDVYVRRPIAQVDFCQSSRKSVI